MVTKYFQKNHRPWHLAIHMVSRAWVFLPLVVATLGVGMSIYHYVEGLSWSDSYLNAAMLLGGMGPVNPLQTELGKLLAGTYALFAGLVFLVVAGGMLAPVVNHVLQLFNLEDEQKKSNERDSHRETKDAKI